MNELENYYKINYQDFESNIFTLFSKNNAVCLFTNHEKRNGLTIGWGTLGTLWSMPICTVYVKPTRYSFEFAETCETFSILFFEDRNILKVFGTTSGKDTDKEKILNLHPFEVDNTIAYTEASMILTFEKLYQNEIKKDFIKSQEIIDKPLYADGLFHHEYVGKLVNIYKRK